ncbi:MAG: thioredoxin family protein [Candidatus Heimdallarchaeota archaeon]|nr:thioredoxin family protein [Candidatus Heimdallarchaeota archaeon]MDH5645098.1 thioredoxin family protein [Candidatus Heimdallarchaeota archaeon]
MTIPLQSKRNQSRYIQIFSDGCKECIDHIRNVEIGKCAGCNLDVFFINEKTNTIKNKIRMYKISIHPTTIIDDVIKVEGVPNFYWLCGGEFFDKLKKEYPLTLEM